MNPDSHQLTIDLGSLEVTPAWITKVRDHWKQYQKAHDLHGECLEQSLVEHGTELNPKHTLVERYHLHTARQKTMPSVFEVHAVKSGTWLTYYFEQNNNFKYTRLLYVSFDFGS